MEDVSHRVGPVASRIAGNLRFAYERAQRANNGNSRLALVAARSEARTDMSAHPGRPMAGPADPELDPTATYALDPRRVDQLLGRVHSSGLEFRQTQAPFTGQPLASVPQSSPSDVASAAAIARATQTPWAATDLRGRSEVLLNLHDLVLDRQNDIIDLIQWESGKARKHAFEEVAHV